MPYQSSNSGRAVEESYDTSDAVATATGSLLQSNINVGASNSAAGEGTTTAELVAKLRFLTSGSMFFILLFHSLRTFLNPVRLTLLVASPMRLIFELVVGVLALFLFLVEARVPVLGEKVLLLMRGFSVGSFQCIDMDVARGRIIALAIIAVSYGLINYLSLGSVSSSKSDSDPTADEMDIPSANATDSTGDDDTKASGIHSSSLFMIMIQCIVFSPSMWILLALTGYTVYIVHAFPEYAQAKAYDIQGDATTTQTASSSGPSWTSNVGDLVRGSGYQTVGS